MKIQLIIARIGSNDNNNDIINTLKSYEDRINKFIDSKEIINIKYTHTITPRAVEIYTAYIHYKTN